MSDEEKDFEVQWTSPEQIKLGEVYPIYGYISDVIVDDGDFLLEVNHNILVKLKADIPEEQKEYLKSRSFDTGVFFIEFDFVASGDIAEDENLKHVCSGIVSAIVFNSKTENHA